MQTFLIGLWQYIKKWFARIALSLFSLCLVLQYFGFPIDEKYGPAVLAVMLLGVYEVLLEIKTAGEEIDFTGITNRLTDLETRIQTLTGYLSPKVNSLFQCKEELKLSLSKIRANEKLVIDHLGLDMGEAWKYIHSLLFDDNCLPEIEYRLLILTDAARPDWPVDVREWSVQVVASLRRIQDDLKKATGPSGITHRLFRVEVRKYDSLPTVHGWSIRQPQRLKLWHFAFCRWNHSTYDWGGANYIKVEEQPDASVVGDLANIFDASFTHLWETSPEMADFKFTNAQWVASTGQTPAKAA